LKLKYDKLLSDFAFNCNLRHYGMACEKCIQRWILWVILFMFIGGMGGGLTISYFCYFYYYILMTEPRGIHIANYPT